MSMNVFPHPGFPYALGVLPSSATAEHGHGHHGHGHGGHEHHQHHKTEDLFGGEKPWNVADWTAQDDRLRGGSSVSNLTVTPIPPKTISPNCGKGNGGGVPGTLATFHGNLDSMTLGGAGFASQRTVDDERQWDLSAFEGIEIEVMVPPGPSPPPPPSPPSDPGHPPFPPGPPPPDEPPFESFTPPNHHIHGARFYTIVLKDCINRGEPDSGKEISWEWNFRPTGPRPPCRIHGYVGYGNDKKGLKTETFRASWKDFKPFYRGKELHDEKRHVRSKDIKRFSIMIRSFFQKQQDGPFSLAIVAIRAIGKGKDHHGHAMMMAMDPAISLVPVTKGVYFDEYDPAVDGADREPDVNEKTSHVEERPQGWVSWIAEMFCGLG